MPLPVIIRADPAQPSLHPWGDSGHQDLEHHGRDPDGPGQRGFHPEVVTGKGQSVGRPHWATAAGVWARLGETLVHLHPAWEAPQGPKHPQCPHSLGSPPTASTPQSPRWLTEEAPASADEDLSWPQNALVPRHHEEDTGQGAP